MYNYKIKFKKKAESENIDDNFAYEIIDDYLNCVYNNGQIIGGYDIYKNDNVFYATFVIPEEDALSEKYNSEYAKVRIEKINEVFDYELIKEGVNLEYSEPCSCLKPTWYYLCTEYYQNSSPLFCGNCGKPIPLYKIPHIFSDKEHRSIIKGWQTSYKDMNKLWCNGHWDRFTIRSA